MNYTKKYLCMLVALFFLCSCAYSSSPVISMANIDVSNVRKVHAKIILFVDDSRNELVKIVRSQNYSPHTFPTYAYYPFKGSMKSATEHVFYSVVESDTLPTTAEMKQHEAAAYVHVKVQSYEPTLFFAPRFMDTSLAVSGARIGLEVSVVDVKNTVIFRDAIYASGAANEDAGSTFSGGVYAIADATKQALEEAIRSYLTKMSTSQEVITALDRKERQVNATR